MNNLLKKTIVTIHILFLFFLCIIWLKYELNKMTPPDNVKNFDEFIKQMPAPDEYFIFQIGEKEYLELRGPLNEITLPSGPQSYVFDNLGRLADWSQDIGDDPEYAKKWSVYRRDKSVNLNEVKKWLKKHILEEAGEVSQP